MDKKTVADYAGEDADIAYRLFEVLKPKLEEFDLIPLFEKLKCQPLMFFPKWK